MLDAETGKRARAAAGQGLVFSSPAVAGNTVFVGVLNGTLERAISRPADLLWEFQTEASKRNAGWVLTADRTFNAPMLYWSSWREVPARRHGSSNSSIGSIFSSPLIVGSAVYFGSTDGNLYALE